MAPYMQRPFHLGPRTNSPRRTFCTQVCWSWRGTGLDYMWWHISRTGHLWHKHHSHSWKYTLWFHHLLSHLVKQMISLACRVVSQQLCLPSFLRRFDQFPMISALPWFSSFLRDRPNRKSCICSRSRIAHLWYGWSWRYWCLSDPHRTILGLDLSSRWKSMADSCWVSLVSFSPRTPWSAWTTASRSESLYVGSWTRGWRRWALRFFQTRFGNDLRFSPFFFYWVLNLKI